MNLNTRPTGLTNRSTLRPRSGSVIGLMNSSTRHRSCPSGLNFLLDQRCKERNSRRRRAYHADHSSGSKVQGTEQPPPELRRENAAEPITPITSFLRGQAFERE